MNGELFNKHLSECAVETEQYLINILAKENILHESLAYSLLDGGKRFRPALALIFRSPDEKNNEHFIKAACAVEFIHAFSLVHDDLPAMDNDDYRRGKLSCHKRFGEAKALLTGDAMSIMAFSLLAGINPPQTAQTLIKELSEASLLMIEGQFMEFQDSKLSQEYILKVHQKKTGALIKAPLRMGAIISGLTPKEFELVSHYGEILGKLFQLTDDLLDIGKGENFNMADMIGKSESLKIISELKISAIEIAKNLPHSDLLCDAAFYLSERTK